MASVDSSGSKPRRLGRGLSSLVGDPVVVTSGGGGVNVSEHLQQATGGGGIVQVELSRIVASPFQPRRNFDEAALQGLANSIKREGLLQPVIVRPVGAKYELVAGERRWRAAQLALVRTIPALVRELSDEESAAWALVENLQREDLNGIERGRAIKSLCDRFGLSHSEIAERLGMDRSTVINFMRLTELEESVQRLIETGHLTAGHGKALLMMAPGPAREDLGRRAAEAGWNVRQLEHAAKARGTPPPTAGTAAIRSASLVDLEKQLGEFLGTKVLIRTDRTGKRGRMTIEFYGVDHFDGLMAKFGFHMR